MSYTKLAPYAGLGLSLPSVPGIDTKAIANEIVAAIGPAIQSQIPALTDALKQQLPGLMASMQPVIQKEIDTLRPMLQAEANNLAVTLLNGPAVQTIKKEAVVGAVVFALAIIGGTYAAVKYL